MKESPSIEVSQAMEIFYKDCWLRERRGESSDEIQSLKIQDQMTDIESLQAKNEELRKEVEGLKDLFVQAKKYQLECENPAPDYNYRRHLRAEMFKALSEIQEGGK